ncbi:MAG: hypothetical protein HY231_17435 [Acidobacteria bacterium]|nr:hypothetical protein [Acidobacteriota bacterium]
MNCIRDYEKKVLYLLASRVLSHQQLEDLVSAGEIVGYDHTGSGYFLSIRHDDLPQERLVCHEPIVTGSAKGVICGFVIFIENGQLTLECHSWGEFDVPEGFRDEEVQVTAT